MKLISVIVPAYNIEKYISRCLDSILAQTYRELEIIAVDDGSTDKSGDILDEYALKDSRIKVIHQENAGLSGARNSALAIASGDYIGYVDGDDYIEPDMYASMLSACEENGAEMAVTAYRQIGEGIVNRTFSGKDIVLSRDEALDIYICDNREFSIYNSVWSRLYKKELVEGESFPVGKNSEDIIYTTKAMCAMTKCVFIDRPLYNYIATRPDSIMNMRLADRRFNDEIPFLKEQLEIFKEKTSEELYDKAVYHYFRRLLFYHNDFKDRRMKDEAEHIANIIREDVPLINRIYALPFVSRGDKKRMDLFLKSPGKYYAVNKLYEDTVVPVRNTPDGSNPLISLIGNTAFYLGVVLEIVIMFLDKADYINPYEGWMFRISFLLFFIKVICTKYSLKEYIAMALLVGLAFVSYRINTRDELVRFAVFLFAMKNIDLKHVLRWVFRLSVFAMILLAILSLTGLLGDVVEQYEGFGFKEGSVRLCLGLGSSNAFAIMIWALMLLEIYLHHEKMKWLHYALATLLSFVIYFTTLTRTTLVIMLCTVFLTFAFDRIKNLRKNRLVYLVGGLLVPVFIAFSAWCASVTGYWEYMTGIGAKIDHILTGRISSISGFEDGGGHITNWLLFSTPESYRYFDMGYVRLFYWYGIVPASVIFMLVLLAIWGSYKTGDYMGFVMIVIMSVFTVIEAHIVSVYIARNYMIFLMGSYLSFLLENIGKKKDRGNYFRDKEEYCWGSYRLLFKSKHTY